MNYFLLAETEFFRRINEAGDCNMEKAYTAFATQVIELCIGSPDTNRTIIALAYIEIELQHHPVRNLPEEKKEIVSLLLAKMQADSSITYMKRNAKVISFLAVEECEAHLHPAMQYKFLQFLQDMYANIKISNKRQA